MRTELWVTLQMSKFCFLCPLSCSTGPNVLIPSCRCVKPKAFCVNLFVLGSLYNNLTICTPLRGWSFLICRLVNNNGVNWKLVFSRSSEGVALYNDTVWTEATSEQSHHYPELTCSRISLCSPLVMRRLAHQCTVILVQVRLLWDSHFLFADI